MSVQNFLVEIGTEELPPKSLLTLSNAFTEEVTTGLKEAGLNFGQVQSFASPRRLAIRIEALATQQPDKTMEKRGPAKNAAFDAGGQPTRALLGFCQSLGIEPSALEEQETPKGTWLLYRATEPGQATVELLCPIVEAALHKLPIPKRMRWGASKAEFVRPVHWVLMLFGNQVVNGHVLNLTPGNTTRGHRFHSSGTITINDDAHYEAALKEHKVLADFSSRREKIRRAVTDIAKTVNGSAVIDDALLDEVTALNEWPVPLLGRFEERFLAVPAEALISSMKEHQKYFHVIDAHGKMLPNFITLANIESKDPAQVIAGNERVIRPRLSDAAFFFTTDKKKTLVERRELLKPIVFQTKLGSIYDKTERVSKLAAQIAGAIGGDSKLAERAGQLAKSDLVTEMVLEFTDLQGTMGYHYAQLEGEPAELAQALKDQYVFTGETMSPTSCALAIAEKVDSLVGLFGINQPPTGTKDPFALRRAALGVLRIIMANQLTLDLAELIQWSLATYPALENPDCETQLIDYFLDRFRAWYQEEGISVEVFLAVSARRPTRPVDFDRRIKAVDSFYTLDAAEALSAANKRVSNILTKAAVDLSSLGLNAALLTEAAEQALAGAVSSKQKEVTPLFEQAEYTQALAKLAALKEPVDAFFKDVMVMADDLAVRNNRLVLLSQLRALFLQVADISLLSNLNP
jgi:glycyl-tRNA synthetase beta chain